MQTGASSGYRSRKHEPSAFDLLGALRRAVERFWRIALGPAVVLVGLTLFLSYLYPNYYSSDALIFIQPQRVTSKLIETPNTNEMRERLEALVQEILSRPRLRSILERYSLYPNLRGPIGLERAVVKFRNEIGVTPVIAPSGNNLLQTFRLSYSHKDPQTAYEITKALSNLFIEESIVDQRSEAQGTEEFLDSQLAEARKKLELTEDLVQQFVSENFGRLPDHLQAAIARLESAQAQVATNSQLITAGMTRRELLQRELDELRRYQPVVGPEASGGETVGGPHEQLARLESALIVLLSKYSEQHPDVISTQQKINALREQLSRPGSTGARTRARGGVSPARSEVGRALRLQVNEIDVETKSLTAENERLKALINQLQLDIQAMPLKEQELLKIKRDYVNVKENYERLLAAKQDAGLQSSLLRSQKATQFRIVEPAELPAIPAGPNRLLISGIGVGSAVFLFLVIPIVLVVTNRFFISTRDVEEELGIPIIGVVPPMPSPQTLAILHRVTTISMVASLFSLLSGGLVIYWIV